MLQFLSDKVKLTEEAIGSVLYKKFVKVLKFFLIFTEKCLCWSSFFDSYSPFALKLYYKETPTQVFSSEYCETFKNTYFEEHL